jgi:hypothetical protein
VTDARRDEALRDGLDGIQADMAQHQRITGKEVTAEANRKLASETFEQIAATSPIGFEQPETVAPQAVQEERKKVTGRSGREYTFLKELDRAGNHQPIKLSPAARREMLKKLHRVHLLLTLPETGPLGAPSWKQRALAVMRVHNNPARFARELDELLEASNATFGDWRKESTKKVILGGPLSGFVAGALVG